MSASPGIKQEIVRLADRLCDEGCEQSEIDRLEELVRGDVRYMQFYLDYLAVHAKLIGKTWEDLPEESIARITESVSKPKRSAKHWAGIIGGVSSVALMLVVGLTLFLIQPPPATAGKLVGLTADAKWAGREYVPGDVVLERMTVSLEAGIASFELNDGAIVSIQGPATIEATSGQETQLINGLLHAFVPEKAIGYSVRTVDVKVVDLGTEFTVERHLQNGTRVVVKQGKVEAKTINESGTERVHELIAGRAMEFQVGSDNIQELASSISWDDSFKNFENVRGGIAKLEGIVRTTPSLPADLRPGQMPTNNYIMLVRECAGIELLEDLTVQQTNGAVTIEAGTVVDSYLLHFDPNIEYSTSSPLGTVTFNTSVLAIPASTESLNQTDWLCATLSPQFYHGLERGLESNLDTVEVSPDRKSLTFHLTRNHPNAMDQCRILVNHKD
ncbi:FecR domain-containing protein [Calycomorphotria hydatis]|uniref:FecR protein n=1 Tax=Calycomorphotria hydatis TaxID=2528027 RepID=A0A517T501_9PLAN|nr:FecR domain-containing protein [Calycomorphotria hydatis]QDT63438.1 FecR protein [Calycomorphotria hydatis]